MANCKALLQFYCLFVCSCLWFYVDHPMDTGDCRFECAEFYLIERAQHTNWHDRIVFRIFTSKHTEWVHESHNLRCVLHFIILHKCSTVKWWNNVAKIEGERVSCTHTRNYIEFLHFEWIHKKGDDEAHIQFIDNNLNVWLCCCICWNRNWNINIEAIDKRQ